MFFDSHAHYNDPKFGTPEQRDALLEKMFSEDVGVIVNSSVTPDDSRATLELCGKFPNMFATVGIHPEDCAAIDDAEDAAMQTQLLAKSGKVVAIGETGLDYFHEPFDKKRQLKFFRLQLDIARKLGMPVVIHDRDAHGDTDTVLDEYKDVKAVLHSFSGSAEWAKKLTADGRYISFSGVVTFKNARKTVEAAEVVPLELMLIETDCPYLAPHPLRGSVNNSQNLIYTAKKLAEIKHLSVEEIINLTFENACRFYGIDMNALKKA